MEKFDLDIIYRPEREQRFYEQEKKYKNITLQQAQKIICDTTKEEDPFLSINVFLYPSEKTG